MHRSVIAHGGRSWRALMAGALIWLPFVGAFLAVAPPLPVNHNV